MGIRNWFSRGGAGKCPGPGKKRALIFFFSDLSCFPIILEISPGPFREYFKIRGF